MEYGKGGVTLCVTPPLFYILNSNFQILPLIVLIYMVLHPLEVVAVNLLAGVEDVLWVEDVFCFFEEADDFVAIHLAKEWCADDTVIVLSGH